MTRNQGSPNWDIDRSYGEQAELFITDVKHAILRDAIEVKRDGRFADTGNIYVEFEAWVNKHHRWEPSGLHRTEDPPELWAYVLGDTETALVIPTAVLTDMFEHYCGADLRRFRETGRLGGRIVEQPRGANPTHGGLLKLSQMMAWLQRRQKDHDLRRAS